jgi:hypothetical protein
VAKSHKRFTYQKAAGVNLAACAAHARRFVYRKVKSGLVQKLALAVVLNWAALVTMTSNRLIIRACALRF